MSDPRRTGISLDSLSGQPQSPRVRDYPKALEDFGRWLGVFGAAVPRRRAEAETDDSGAALSR